jgi:hypothetical protein
MFNVVACPECRQVVAVVDRSVLERADGPEEHVPVVRGDGHDVFRSTEGLDWDTAARASVPS